MAKQKNGKEIHNGVAMSRRLLAWIEHKNLKQIEVSRLTGIVQPVISQLMRGKSIPGFDTLVKMHKHTDLDVWWWCLGDKYADLKSGRWSRPAGKRGG